MLLDGVTVMVVEDEPLVANMIEEMVRELGSSDVIRADGVEDALDLLSDKKPDVVMLDLNLNGKLSYPIAAKLAQQNIPFVFSTVSARATLLPPWNMRTSLQKPFSQAQLESALKEALDAVLF